MKNWKAWIWVIAIFVSGLVLGIFAGHLMAFSNIQKAAKDPEFRRQLIVKRLARKLDLTEDQRKSVDSIIADAQVSIRDMRQEVQPRFMDVIKNAERQITEVLNAEQQEEFRKLMEEKRRLWKVD